VWRFYTTFSEPFSELCVIRGNREVAFLFQPGVFLVDEIR